MDDPKDEAKALQFLTKEHAAVPPGAKKAVAEQGRSTNNYIFTGAGGDALAQALDPKWPGGYPYTLVIAPGGEILYRFRRRPRCSRPPVKADRPHGRLLQVNAAGAS